MSHDTVDDLHQAEDALGFLRARLEEVVALLKPEVDRSDEDILSCHECAGPMLFGTGEALDLSGPIEAALKVAEAGVEHGRAYCRCELEWDDGRPDDNYTCDDDCGCPAEHELPHRGSTP